MHSKLELPQPKPNPSASTAHPARKYFLELQKAKPPGQLKDYLSRYNTVKTVDSETFIDGVKLFVELANIKPLDPSKQGRQTLFGTVYGGLHYDNDLVNLWNTAHREATPLKVIDVTGLVPPPWSCTVQDGFISLIYHGQQPAEAMDELIKGPTVIDCGMFTQLSLWFGIRYMLGNEAFNYYFGRVPFLITQIVYQEIEDCNKPYAGNPLFPFLATPKQSVIPTVTIKHIKNSLLYPLKHPGGNHSGENCIVINNLYYIFDPHVIKTQSLTEAEVLNLLREGFNAAPSQQDRERLLLYALNPQEMHPKLRRPYGQLIMAAKTVYHKTLTEQQFRLVKQNPSLELTFDISKFSMWLKRMDNKFAINSKYIYNQFILIPKLSRVNMAHIKVHLINSHGFTSRSSIILENTSTTPHTYYEMDRWKDPQEDWNQSAKKLIPAPKSRVDFIRCTVLVIDIQADPEEVVSDWKKYWTSTKSTAEFLGNNSAVASQWFLTKYANIHLPPLSIINLSWNHAFWGLWWPSFIPAPTTLPGRVMSNAKFYLEAINHPEIANHFAKLFLKGWLLVAGGAFAYSSKNISSANSATVNATLIFTAGLSSISFFKAWNLLSAQDIADANKKYGSAAAKAEPNGLRLKA